MPDPASMFNMVHIPNTDDIFIWPGASDSYIYNLATDTITPAPSYFPHRIGAFVGRFELLSISSDCILVAGGYDLFTAQMSDTVEMLRLDTMEWYKLNENLPLEIGFGLSVPHENTFLAVGGWDKNFLDSHTVYEFDPTNLAFVDTGNRISMTMSTAVGTSVAMMVPDDIVDCPDKMMKSENALKEKVSLDVEEKIRILSEIVHGYTK